MKLHNRSLPKNTDRIRFFAEKIGFTKEESENLIKYYESDFKYVNRLRKKNLKAIDGNRFVSKVKKKKGDKAYIALLSMVLLKAQDTLSLYRKEGIDEEIFYDTMKDIVTWCENLKKEKGIFGIDNIDWLKNHLNGNLFRLGRLQFQRYFMHYPSYVSKSEKQRINLPAGKKAIYVHIPQGEKLSTAECEKSFERAREFFSDYPYVAFICESWLLYEGNKNFMDSNSNILNFAKLFDVLGSSPKPEQTIERVFGGKERDPALYPENTSLQRSCKAYLISGGKIGVGFGIIKR